MCQLGKSGMFLMRVIWKVGMKWATINTGSPLKPICVADCYFIVNVLDLPCLPHL